MDFGKMWNDSTRERNCIDFLARLVGKDGGPGLDTLEGWCLRVEAKLGNHESTSEHCSRTHEQNCHCCENAGCCDNMTPSIVELKNKLSAVGEWEKVAYAFAQVCHAMDVEQDGNWTEEVGRQWVDATELEQKAAALAPRAEGNKEENHV